MHSMVYDEDDDKSAYILDSGASRHTWSNSD